MKKRVDIKLLAKCIAIPLLVGAVVAFISGGGMEVFESVNQPPLSPPAWLFPVVWTILYTLMGISAARVWMAQGSPERSKGLNLYVAQLIVNFFWSLLFFNAQAFGFAFLWLIHIYLNYLSVSLSL